MAATISPKISSAYSQILADFPEITFLAGNDFHWSASENAIYHPKIFDHDSLCQLLHEIGHAKLDHSNYQTDAELIDMERQAWDYAVDHLTERYGLKLSVNDDIVQDSLDTYRDWLSARSTCPKCQAIGLGIDTKNYKCLNCHQQWRVNEARICGLKRYKK